MVGKTKKPTKAHIIRFELLDHVAMTDRSKP